MARPDRWLTSYQRALLVARQRTNTVGATTLQRIVASFNTAIADIARDVDNGVITKTRARKLKQDLVGALSRIEQLSARATAEGVKITVDNVVDAHRGAMTFIEGDSGVAGIVKEFDRAAARASVTIASRTRNAANMRSLVKYHVRDAIPSIDAMIESGVARGVSSRRLAKDLARLLGGGDIAYGEYGVAREAATGLRTVFYDARRIAVSEINNALRETNAASMSAGRVVRAAKWQLSGAHPKPDACDVLAESDWYGFGAGFYDPRQWPMAPHPFCGCYQGSVLLRPVAEWKQPRAAPPPILDEPTILRPSGLTDSELRRAVDGARDIVDVTSRRTFAGR